jgi:hypothetical protein
MRQRISRPSGSNQPQGKESSSAWSPPKPSHSAHRFDSYGGSSGVPYRAGSEPPAAEKREGAEPQSSTTITHRPPSFDFAAISLFPPEPQAARTNGSGLGGGRALDPATRSFMEPRFGANFSNVRIHADDGAARSAASLGARAYAAGHHVVFGAGEYAPGSTEGRRLLAHELAHVAQREKAAAGACSDGAGARLANASLDRNADEAADAVLAGRTPQIRAGNFHLGLKPKPRIPEYKQHPCDDKEPTNAKIIGFIRAHRSDAETIATQAGVPGDWILAVAAEETEYGTSGIVTRTNNYFGLHVKDGNDVKHFDGQTGAEKTKGSSVWVAVFSSSTGFKDSGMGFVKIAKDSISGVKDFAKFANIIHAHWYGVDTPTYVEDLTRVHDLIAKRIDCPTAK